ncbi:MAG TPA: hypothetical protein VK034_22270, partial [Enhygromyxa sp.]|nr:hypothetical protein [Enhygromyxa sp.]
RVACTDPLALLGGSKLAGADLPTFSNQPLAFPPFMPDPPVSSAFVRYGDFYRSECLTDLDGHGYLAISVVPEAGDVRENLVDFEDPLLNPGFLGLHVLDFNFAMAELLELVAIKAEAG